MPPHYTKEEFEKMQTQERRTPKNRTQMAAKKALYRYKKKTEKKRQSLVGSEISFQPPTTPKSYQRRAMKHRLPATATPPIDRQATDREAQYEVTKQVADLVVLIKRKLEEAEPATGLPMGMSQDKPSTVAQIKEDLAKLVDRLNLMNQYDETTLPVSDMSAVSSLSSVAPPVLSTSRNPPPRTDKDPVVSSEFIGQGNEIAARTDEMETEVRCTTNKQPSSASAGDPSTCADGLGEAASDDMSLQGVSNRQDRATTESLEVEGSEGEDFDVEQHLTLDGNDLEQCLTLCWIK